MAIADGTFYRPTTRQYARPEEHDIRYEDVFFPSEGGASLHGWFFPARQARGTVLHCHGNAGNITGHFGYVAWLPAAGWNVLCFDYRGYGRSTGKATRSGTIADVEAAARYLRTRSDVRPDRICLFGQSLGGAVGIVAAARGDLGLRGMCLEGPFSSYRTEARFVTRRTWYTWAVSPLIARYFISDELSAIDFAGRLPAIPKLFIAGTADPIVDPRQIVDLHDAASRPKELWLIEDGGHTEAATGEIEGGRERVLAFLDRCVEDGL